jgi:hypothetical protein
MQAKGAVMGATADRRGGSLSRAIASAVALGFVAALGAVGLAGAPGAAAAEASDPRLTDSAVTVTVPQDHPVSSLRGLSVTVSQTRNLVNQAIEITWKGWQPSTPLGRFTGNFFMQVMQCWGGEDPDVPGMPDRRACQWGFTTTTIGNRISRSAISGGDRVPFRAVDGTELSLVPVRGSVVDPAGANQYWNASSQNAVQAATTGADGTGSVDFEVQTGAEAPGLGCGDRIVTDGAVAGRPCWLVVVPRGDGDTNESPMNPVVWASALAVELDFVPSGQACELGRAEVRIAGSELLTDASLSWQRALCASGEVYTYSELGEPEARRQVAAGSAGAPSAAVVVRPFDEGAVRGDGVDYAPMALSAIVVGYVYEAPQTFAAPPEIAALQGTRIEGFKLTPRLLAKLLTMSYRGDLSQALSGKRVDGTFYDVFPISDAYEWGRGNPLGIIADPEFVALNPAARWWNTGGEPFNFMVPLENSDTTRMVWEWIVQDAHARLWLSGVPDEWGMRVNPYYATNADLKIGRAHV